MIKVYILIKFVHFFILNSLIVYSVGWNFDCKDCKDWILIVRIVTVVIVRIVTGGMWIFTIIFKKKFLVTHWKQSTVVHN